jgi:hypothetical protein
MRILTGSALVAAIVLALAGQGTAAGHATVSNTYTVGVLTVPGVDTGLVLKKGHPVTVTATGTVCPGTGYCTSPDGTLIVDTTQSSFGGFVLPGAPAYGLVGRVGTGPWVQVGTGPTKLSGSGDLVFAFNDDLFPDNTGSFVVTVSTVHGSNSSDACYPGWGYGDTNHEHSGPPGVAPNACYPGWGYGDTNHEHSGPPGRGNTPSSSGDSSAGKGGKGGTGGNSGR